MNHITLIGSLAQLPDLRYAPSGLPILTLNMAGTDLLNRDGKALELPWYHRVTIFGKQAETLAQIPAGDAVAVTGRLDYRAWESQDGQKRQAVDVVAEGFVQHLGTPTDVDTDAKGQSRMRGAVNAVMVRGNLTRDADPHYTSNGVPFTRLGLAVNDRYQKDGEWVERTHFIDATTWRGAAEASTEFSKGQSVLVRGRLVNSKWTDKEGQQRYATKIEADGAWAVHKTGAGRTAAPAQLDIDDNEFPPEEVLPF